MASGTYYPAANGDDGHRLAADYYTANSYVWFGDIYLGSFILFTSASIPQGATITSAKLRLKCANNVAAGTGSATIYGVDADEQAAVAAYDDATYDALPLTSASTSVPAAGYTSGTWYEWTITAAVQEIVSRGSFAESTIAIKIVDTDTSLAKRFYAYDYSGGSNKPELVVEWSTVEEVSQTDATVLGDSVDGDSPHKDFTDAASLGDSVEAVGLSGKIADATALGDSVDGQNLSGKLTDDAALGDAVTTEAEYSVGLTDDADLADTIDAVNLSQKLTEAIELGDSSARFIETDQTLTEAAGLTDAADAFNFTAWLRRNRNKITYRYECTVTGTADGEADVFVPIKTVQARLRAEGSSYAAVVIPSVDYADAVTARANGQIVIEMVAYIAGVEQLREEIIRVNLDAVRLDEGTTSESITIEGHRTITFATRQSALDFVTYKRFSDGKYSFRCAIPDWYLRPGHVATYGEISFTVDNISFYIMVTDRVFQSNMEVNE